jgi:hypothetical protein
MLVLDADAPAALAAAVAAAANIPLPSAVHLVGRLDAAVDESKEYLQGVQVIIGATANELELLSPVHQLVCVCVCVCE